MDPSRKERLKIAALSALVLVGGLVFLLGVVETWVAWRHPEQGGSLREGLIGIGIGLLVGGVPLAFAYARMVRHILQGGHYARDR